MAPPPLAIAREVPADAPATSFGGDGAPAAESAYAPAEGAPSEAPAASPPAGEGGEGSGTSTGEGEGGSTPKVDEQLVAAIRAAMDSYMGELKSQIVAEHEAREAAIRARITKLEGSVEY